MDIDTSDKEIGVEDLDGLTIKDGVVDDILEDELPVVADPLDVLPENDEEDSEKDPDVGMYGDDSEFEKILLDPDGDKDYY